MNTTKPQLVSTEKNKNLYELGLRYAMNKHSRKEVAFYLTTVEKKHDTFWKTFFNRTRWTATINLKSYWYSRGKHCEEVNFGIGIGRTKHAAVVNAKKDAIKNLKDRLY
jgi:hypothetical protein